MSEDEINQLPELSSIYNDKALTKPRNYPRMKKRTKSIVKYIETQLGGNVLELELTPTNIKEIVEQEFDELKHYISDTYQVIVLSGGYSVPNSPLISEITARAESVSIFLKMRS